MPEERPVLDRDRLATYLNDHLGGAHAAVSLLARIEPDPADGLDVAALRREIEADVGALESLLASLGERPSGVKKAAGRIAETLTRPKLPDDEALGRFELLELLALGILGKRELWRALREVSDGDPRLVPSELERLEQRAREQFERVEAARVVWARRALLAA
jgi:hypothetical protein